MKMNLTKYLALAVGCLGLLHSCSDHDDLADYDVTKTASSLRLSNNSYTLKANGNSTAMQTVYHLNALWETQGLPSWIEQEPLSGGGQGEGSTDVTYTINDNYSGNIRTALVSYDSQTNGNHISRTCSFTQEGSEAFAEIEVTDFDYNDDLGFPASNGSYSLAIKTNVDLQLKSEVDWISLSRTSISAGVNDDGNAKPTEIVMTLEANPSIASRTGIVYGYVDGNKLDGWKIVQQGATTHLDITTVTMDRDASNTTLTLKSDAPWTAVVTTQTPSKGYSVRVTDAEWLQVSPSNGSGGESHLTLSTTNNTNTLSRTAYVAFCFKGNEKVSDYICVTQKPSFLDYADNQNANTFVARMEGETLKACISSNAEWVVDSKPDWIVAKPMKGKGSAEIALTAARNETGDTREGAVTVKLEGASNTSSISPNSKTNTSALTFTIRQNGPNITLDKSDVQFDGNGGTHTLTLKSDTDWKAEVPVEADWLSVTPTSGSGSASLQVKALPNNSRNRRSAKVTVTSGKKVTTFTVVQDSKYIKLSESALVMSSEAHTWEISVKSSSTWKVVIPDSTRSWVKADISEGKGDQTIRLSISDNASAITRQGVLNIVLDNGQTMVASIRQEGRFLTLSRTSIQSFAKGGKLTLTAKTDGILAFTKTGDWFEVSCTEGGTVSSFSISIPQNATQTTRKGSIRFWLIDLTDGSKKEATVSVVQLPDGQSFGISGFGEDEDFNANGNEQNGTIHLGGFGDDENFN